MLEKLKNKKVSIGISLALVASLALGATYAYFTTSATAEPSSAELGYLEAAVAFETDAEDVLLQPSSDIEVEGTIKNTGSLAYMAKVTLNPTTTIYSDSNGKLLPNNGSYTIPNDENVTVEFIPESLVSRMYDDGKIIAWFNDKNNPDDYYVLIEDGLEEEVEFIVLLDGPGMGNHYMRATVNLESGISATQTRDGALKEAWGVTRQDDLVMVGWTDDVWTRSFANPYQAILDRVEELFAE